MRLLSNRTIAARVAACVLVLPFAGSGAAYGNADLLDVIARIDYGYYAGDARLLAAASAELERLSGHRAERSYYGAYAAWRLNQIDAAASPRVQRERTEHCLASLAALADEPSWALEAHVLSAACALWAHDAQTARGAGFHAKLVRSIEAARSIDPRNPRLLLVAALALPVEEQAERRDVRLSALEEALAGFDEQTMVIGLGPSWGRPEVLANLGAIHLERGQAREARDLIERALLEAPGYHFALDLQKALSLQ